MTKEKIVYIAVAIVAGIALLVFLFSLMPDAARGQGVNAIVPTLDADSIRGIPVSDRTPQATEALVYNGDSLYYIPDTVSGVGGGGADADSIRGIHVSIEAPANGEVLMYYLTGDTLAWESVAGGGDVTDVIGGDGLVDNGDTGPITVDALLGWGLAINNDSIVVDSTNVDDVFPKLSGATYTGTHDFSGATVNLAANTVKYDDIGDPDAHDTIAFGSYSATFESNTGGWWGLTIANSEAVQGAFASLLRLKYAGDGQSNAHYIIGLDNAGADTLFSFQGDGLFRCLNPYRASFVADSMLMTKAYIDNYALATDVMWNDGDTTTGTYVFVAPYRGNSSAIDSLLINVDDLHDSLVSYGLVNVMWNDGDTVTGTHVFAAAFKGTSAQPDSEYATINYVDGHKIKWRDSSYVYLDTLDALAGNTELKAWIDTTAVHIPVSDSADGGAARAEVASAVRSGTNPTTDATDNIATDTDDNALEIFAATQSRLIPTVQHSEARIFLPHFVRDSISVVEVLNVHSSWAPHGITLLKVGIATNNSSSYTVIFEEWTAPNDGSPSQIDTVATSSSYEAEDDGTLNDSSIAAGSYVYAELPTTIGTMQLVAWISYYVNPGD